MYTIDREFYRLKQLIVKPVLTKMRLDYRDPSYFFYGDPSKLFSAF